MTAGAAAAARAENGDLTRLPETETWLALACRNLAAAVAGVDAEQLAAARPEPAMTGQCWGCGRPDPEAGQ